MHLSTIGHAISEDGINFENHNQLIKPEYDWEAFGCEDPRVTKLDNKYFIFYTALSAHPFSAKSIKIGVAITKDFKTGFLIQRCIFAAELSFRSGCGITQCHTDPRCQHA